MKKKLFAFCMILLLATSTIAGCGNDAGKETKTGDTSGSRTKGESGGGTGSVGISDASSQRYEEEITVTAPLLLLEPDAKVPDGYTPETNEYIRLFKEELNINLEFEWIVESEYEQKWGVTVASGNLPDLFRGQSDYNDLKEQGALYDLREVYEEYASDLTRAYFDSGYKLLTEIDDGAMYALARVDEDTYSEAGVMYYRKDWLDQLGLEVPETIEDLENVMAAFSKADLGGTGGAVYPANKGFFGQGLADFTPIFVAFGSYPSYDFWFEEDGEIISSITQDETYEALALLNKWYQNGWINQDFASIDVWASSSPIVTDIVAGKYGIVPGSWWIPNWPLNEQKLDDPSAEWVAGPVPTVEGYEAAVVKNVAAGKVQAYNCVSAKSEHPEALIKMMNLYLETKLCINNPTVEGTEKEGWGMPENGFVYSWLPFQAYYGNTLIDNYELVNKLIDEGSDNLDGLSEDEIPYNTEFYDLWTNSLAYQEDSSDALAWGMYYSRVARDGGLGTTYYMRENFLNLTNVMDMNHVYSSAMQYESVLTTLRDETFLKMIMGETPLREWDNFVSQWKSLGGDAIYDEVVEVMNASE